MIQRVNAAGQKLCPSGGSSNPCDPYQLTKTADNTLFDNIISESLSIGGAPINFYKLLGITTRTEPQNFTGRGKALGSENIAGFPPAKVFDGSGSFRSQARGPDVLTSAYIGYDFGEYTMPDGSIRNGMAAYADRKITMVVLDQSHCVEWTASKIRVEQSMDGIRWTGVAIISDVAAGQGVYRFGAVTPSRYWRIRPVEFRGTGSNDFWEVTSLFLGESGIADINNIEDAVLFENRNREYSIIPLAMKGRFDHQDSQLNLSVNGMVLEQSLSIEVSFSQCLAVLGRPPVIGDIIELPSEAMYDQNLNAVKKFVEVTDVAWSSTSYTPGWVPTLLRLTTAPAIASRETQDIFGSTSSSQVDPAGYFEQQMGVEGSSVQDYKSITDTIRAEALSAVPFRGIDQSNIGQPTLEEQQKVEAKIGPENVAPFMKPQTGAYVEDAMPPNNEPYGESAELPSIGADGAYHRVIYTGAAHDIPARLYRWSGAKGRWIYLESDKRGMYSPLSPQKLPPGYR